MAIMKHQALIDKFIKNADEFDGYCHIFWLPSSIFDGILPAPRTDILGAWLDAETSTLEFLTSAPPDDNDQQMVLLGELPFHVQRELVDYFKTYQRANA